MRYAIIGSGICGLLAAKNILMQDPQAQVKIIEKSPDFGGLLSGNLYDNDLYFDQGTHIPRETGNALIDEFMLGAIPLHDRLHFEVGQGDVSGAVFDGKLQTGTHFPDIRHLRSFPALLEDIQNNLLARNVVEFSPERAECWEGQAKDKFGKMYVSHVLSPILTNLYQIPVTDLSWFALELPGLTRVLAHDMEQWKEVSCEADRRAVFAVPDQRQLPDEYRSSLRSFYTKSRGTKAFVEALVDALTKNGCQFFCNASVSSLDINKKQFYIDSNGTQEIHEYDRIIIATGVIGAAHLLGIKLSDYGFEKPMSHRLIHIVSEHIVPSDLCYFYGLDGIVDFYRVTNYSAITGDRNDRRLTIEVLGERAEDDQRLAEKIIHQLHDIEFLRNENTEFCDVVKLPAGFPLPTVRNLKAMDRLREEIEKELPSTAILGGIGAGKGLFFQGEIIRHILDATSNSME